MWVHVYMCGHDACVCRGVRVHVCGDAYGDPSACACTYGVYICLCVCVGVHCTYAGVHGHACGDLRWALGIFYHSTLHSLAKGLVSLN